MNTAYETSFLPLDNAVIDQKYFFEELIDATTKLEVYKEKSKTANLTVRGLCRPYNRKKHLLLLSLTEHRATEKKPISK